MVTGLVQVGDGSDNTQDKGKWAGHGGSTAGLGGSGRTLRVGWGARGGGGGARVTRRGGSHGLSGDKSAGGA